MSTPAPNIPGGTAESSTTEDTTAPQAPIQGGKLGNEPCPQIIAPVLASSATSGSSLLENSQYWNAGVIPITFTLDNETGAVQWKILLGTAQRGKDAREQVHMLVGKRKALDGCNPIKTAIREFHRETRFVFKDFLLEKEIMTAVRDYSLFEDLEQEKLFLFFSFVPYIADIQSRFSQAKAAGPTIELFWFPLDDFIEKEGDVALIRCIDGQTTQYPTSQFAKKCVGRSSVLEKMKQARNLISERIRIEDSMKDHLIREERINKYETKSDEPKSMLGANLRTPGNANSSSTRRYSDKGPKNRRKDADNQYSSPLTSPSGDKASGYERNMKRSSMPSSSHQATTEVSSRSPQSSIQKSPASDAPYGASPRTPPPKNFGPRNGSSPLATASPLTPISDKYAAGVLPIALTVDSITGELAWKIMLVHEFRDHEKREVIHITSGKKEKCDENSSIKTGVREFHEETNWAFKDFDLERQIVANVRDHSLYALIPEAKMFIFFSYIPYRQKISKAFIQGASADSETNGLFWHPLDDFIQRKGDIKHSVNGREISISKLAGGWFAKNSLLSGLAKMREITLLRMKDSHSPLAPPTADNNVDEGVANLSNQLRATLLNTTPVKMGTLPVPSPKQSSSSPSVAIAPIAL